MVRQYSDTVKGGEMQIQQLSDVDLHGAVKALERAKTLRQGGLLIGEQKALDAMREELSRREGNAGANS